MITYMNIEVFENGYVLELVHQDGTQQRFIATSAAKLKKLLKEAIDVVEEAKAAKEAAH